MRTKLLYVLVSSEIDIYLEQAYISMMSAIHHMPDVHISIIMDSNTEKTLKSQRRKILDIVREIVVIDLPDDLTGQQRSRILKTSCRKYIDGDFLFIDCDTIIVRQLDEIDSIPDEIAACRDAHTSLARSPYRDMCINHCKRIGVDITNENTYFNSGVILVKDTPAVRNFYNRWAKNWLNSFNKGIYMDQPSLAQTNIEFNHIIHTLPDSWNCQVIHGIKFLQNAKIVHYLCTSPTKKGDEQMFILRDKEKIWRLKNDMKISTEIADCFENPTDGIPECVHVLSGNNTTLCQTDIFRFMEKFYGTRIFKIINKIFKGINLLPKIPKYISSKITK